MRLRGTRLSRESGQVVVLFALLLPVLFGIGAIVLDIGNWYVHKRHLQTQVDAAALAAAAGFSGCFQDASAANLAIASAALAYAGDTARDPAARNQQVESPGSVRVTLNSQRYWAAGDTATPTATGYGTILDAVGDNSAGTPCATSTLDVKATDFDTPKLFSWLGIRPDIKAHARVEIHEEEADMGFLPLAVPEIDPNFVYAIFVDYNGDGTQTPIKVQELEKDPSYDPFGTGGFPYSAWRAKSEAQVPGNTQIFIPSNTATGVVILVSKSDVAPSKTGTLNAICTQPPTDLVQCYSGTGTSGYDGAATKQGLTLIHGFQSNAAVKTSPVLKDVTLGAISCPPAVGAGNLVGSQPWYVNDDNDCFVGVTATVDFGQTVSSPATGDPSRKPPKGFCAGVSGLSWQSTSGTISTWTGTISVPVASGPNPLALGWVTQTTGGTKCDNTISGTFTAPAAMSYGTDDNSGPIGYLHLDATGTGMSCPAGTSVADPHSVPKENYCYSVVVGLDQPLAQKPWSSPSIVLRFASKSTRKGGSGTANLNGSLLCDSGRTLEESFTTGCLTMYDRNFKPWGNQITPACSPNVDCWKDVLCSAYPPSSLPPASYLNNPLPICVAAKNGQVQAFQAGIYNRFEDPANITGGCSRNNWPTTQAQADQFFKDKDYTNDSRYVTLVITDNTAFSSSNTAEPVKYFADFYVTGWDTGNGAGKPKGCYGFSPGAGTCGNPNSDAHPYLGCLAGKVISGDNGDMWGHFILGVDFSSDAITNDKLCNLTSGSVQKCAAVLVE
jgi:Flp pilus assembly protein TadG